MCDLSWRADHADRAGCGRLGSRGQDRAARYRSGLCGPDDDHAVRRFHQKTTPEMGREVSVVSADIVSYPVLPYVISLLER
jgi:hypothetical protein